MSITIALKKVMRTLNDFGIWEVIMKGVQYTLKGIYVNRAYRVYRRDLAVEKFPVKVPEGVVIRIVNNNDNGAMRQIEEMEEWLTGKLSVIMTKGICIAAFKGATVIGFNLVSFREGYVSLLNLKLRNRPKFAWSDQITILKKYRKQGLASALRYHVFIELQKRGIEKLYGGTLISNIPSQKLAGKTGFQFVSDVKYTKFLNREQRIWRRIKHVNY